MKKEDLINTLQICMEDLDTAAGDVDQIMSTPVEDLRDLIMGKKTDYYRPAKPGIYDLIVNTINKLEDIVNELEEEKDD